MVAEPALLRSTQLSRVKHCEKSVGSDTSSLVSIFPSLPELVFGVWLSVHEEDELSLMLSQEWMHTLFESAQEFDGLTCPVGADGFSKFEQEVW